jgi:hypothetical protein
MWAFALGIPSLACGETPSEFPTVCHVESDINHHTSQVRICLSTLREMAWFNNTRVLIALRYSDGTFQHWHPTLFIFYLHEVAHTKNTGWGIAQPDNCLTGLSSSTDCGHCQVELWLVVCAVEDPPKPNVTFRRARTTRNSTMCSWRWGIWLSPLAHSQRQDSLSLSIISIVHSGSKVCNFIS